MKPEQWQEMNLLFHSALEREPSQRAAFLDQACAGDESLRKEVEAFIAAYDQAGSFIEAPAFAVAAKMLGVDQGQSLVGHSFGRYGIVAAIGAGGMGEVYLAQDTQLGRKVALKLLPSYFTMDQGRVRRFQQEARAASALNHPNIITIHEIGQVGGRHFIATEFIDGETLRAPLSRSRFSLRATLDVAIQVASALVAAHKAEIVHRDIKPENIMVRRDDGIVKVLDFGLVKLTEKHAEQIADSAVPTRVLVKTDAGVVMGTVSYMSPEQARGLNVDARTDIWSLGVLLYEMVAGRLPFAGETSSDVIASILTTEPPLLTRLAPETPAELERIMSKTLAKDREERYQTAKDLVIDLRKLRQRLDVDAEIERTSIQEAGGAIAGLTTHSVEAAVETVHHSAILTGDRLNTAQPTSSAEYVVSEVKRHKAAALVALAALAIALVAAYAYFSYSGSRSAGITSVAVLPFANANGDPEIEYLSDGISESLINSLSQLPQLKVIARSSSFKYKGQEVDPHEVARALGVQALVTGRFVQRGGMLLVSAELVDARDKTQIWGEQYNRRAEDLFQVQSEISREIAERLRLRLTTGQQQQLAKRETVNPEAYELFLKGRFYWNKGGTEDAKKAVEYFQQAIAVDPAYAPAYAELSRSYGDLVNSSNLDPKEFTPKAEAAARKALELDESLAEAHLAHGGIKIHTWYWAGAEREFKRALELNPNLAEAHAFYSFYLSLVGRHEQANAETKRARELDPLSPQVNASVGYQLLLARQYDQAIEALKRSLELEQNTPHATRLLGDVYAMKGMYAEAIATYQQVIKLGGDQAGTQIYLGAAYAKAGDRERAQAILKRLETKKEYVSPAELVVLYVALGEREQAFASLERAYAAHDSQLQFLGVDPSFDPLRSDPRFKDLLRRVGLPP